eukprot:TRINITY_DN61453_c0_g1_i1.p1 TRINITY_DN61453_c0_g1~~TRINITY_DN61453_c0_g1_i1.p1  ORF type:complete len:111 (-),score=7.91 TRINITY_DN61453_c0_g1_i1:52-348(-)
MNLKDFERTAVDSGFQLRTGCMCNPGACHTAVGLTPEDVVRLSDAAKYSCGGKVDLVHSKPLGAIRLSVGYPTLLEEVKGFGEFMTSTFVNRKLSDLI